jgi:hypothetical protein
VADSRGDSRPQPALSAVEGAVGRSKAPQQSPTLPPRSSYQVAASGVCPERAQRAEDRRSLTQNCHSEQSTPIRLRIGARSRGTCCSTLPVLTRKRLAGPLCEAGCGRLTWRQPPRACPERSRRGCRAEQSSAAITDASSAIFVSGRGFSRAESTEFG